MDPHVPLLHSCHLHIFGQGVQVVVEILHKDLVAPRQPKHCAVLPLRPVISGLPYLPLTPKMGPFPPELFYPTISPGKKNVMSDMARKKKEKTSIFCGTLWSRLLLQRGILHFQLRKKTATHLTGPQPELHPQKDQALPLARRRRRCSPPGDRCICLKGDPYVGWIKTWSSDWEGIRNHWVRGKPQHISWLLGFSKWKQKICGCQDTA